MASLQIGNGLLTESESTPLIAESPCQYGVSNRNSRSEALVPFLVLPISFLAAFSIAVTAASSIFSYAQLICKDPTHCRDSEMNKYAGSVAIASILANVCGVLALGYFEKLSRHHRQRGLGIWILCRSMSVFMLALGVYLRSITVAISGRVFQGLASDNLLHFNLNALYVQNTSSTHTSTLIGASLALFMLGISIGPAVASLFQGVFISFFLALGVFSFTFLYLVLFIPTNANVKGQNEQSAVGDELSLSESSGKNWELSWQPFRSLATIILSPLMPFYTRSASLASGVALFLYNMAQSYIFSLIMVHTSLSFGFSSRENGILISIVHLVSALYMFIVLFGIPRLMRRYHLRGSSELRTSNLHRSIGRDAVFALISLGTQTVALVGFANATKTWEIYVLSAVFALGLATPSFIKSHFLGFFREEEATTAMGALTMVEVLGSLLSPLLLGGWQSMWPGTEVFYVASGFMLVTLCFFSISASVLRNSPVDGDA